MRRIVLILIPIMFTVVNVNAQTVKAASIGFYNLENLFDTENDTTINDEDFLPTGSYTWTEEKYNNKLKNMSLVISQLGDSEDGTLKWGGPTFLGVSEIENRKVLEDLVATPKLKQSNYGIVQYNSPDKRGIDVAFLYKKDQFKVTNSKTYMYFDKDDPDRRSRDQLLVSGVFDTDTLHFIINHWPSRAAPSEKRVIAAKVCRGIVDSLLAKNKDAKIYVMGDFNDTPMDESLYYLEHKSITKKPENKKVIKLFNPLRAVQKSGDGTHAYHDVWSVFDMIVISPGARNGDGYMYKQASVYKRPFMFQEEGPYTGYPKRTHAGGQYLNGYSDHLPVYMYIYKEVE